MTLPSLRRHMSHTDSTSPAAAAAQASPPAPQADDVLVREQVHDVLFRRRFDIVKAVIAFVGAVTAFVLLSRPDAVLNRSVSRENVARERARMLLEVLREPDAVVPRAEPRSYRLCISRRGRSVD